MLSENVQRVVTLNREATPSIPVRAQTASLTKFCRLSSVSAAFAILVDE